MSGCRVRIICFSTSVTQPTPLSPPHLHQDTHANHSHTQKGVEGGRVRETHRNTDFTSDGRDAQKYRDFTSDGRDAQKHRDFTSDRRDAEKHRDFTLDGRDAQKQRFYFR